MVYQLNIKLDNPIVRTPIPPLVKGDTLEIDVTLLLESGQDITNWKFRAEIADFVSNLRFASANCGGSDDQIKVTNGTQGTFVLTVAENLTTNLQNQAGIELSVETDETPARKFTLIQQTLRFKTEKITWDQP